MTEISVQPVSVAKDKPLDDDEDDVAFKVLNNDNLPLTIIGESLLKPFAGSNVQKIKPNGIVLPQRRITNTLEVGDLEENRQKPFTKSNGHIDQPPVEKAAIIKRSISSSHGQLNHCNSAVKIRIEDLQNHGLDKNFTKALDAKLRKLQLKDDHSGHQHKITLKKNDISKPRFVTCVKKGEFLEPPPELASLLGIRQEDERKAEEKKQLYAYASQPRVLDRNVLRIGHKARCEAAAVAAGFPIDEVVVVKKEVNGNGNGKRIADAPLPYQNLMYERRVVRGANFAPPPMSTGDGESAAARAAEARRRAMARRKAQSQQMKAAALRLGSPPPVKGRRHTKAQTEQYLEELFENPDTADMTTQTDLFLDRPRSPFYVPAKTGVDVETQIYPGDLFDFDVEVTPILEVLVGKTIEQALIEVLEEEELAALREQQRRFMEKHSSELAEYERLHELERRLQGEKERRLSEYDEGMRTQKEMEERIAAAVLMQGYLADMLPSVLEGLEDEGFLTDSIKQNIDESFIPWLMKEVTAEMQEMVSSRDILTDIVREILENRAEIYRALHAEPREESEEEGTVGQDIQLIEHLRLKQEIKSRDKEGELDKILNP